MILTYKVYSGLGNREINEDSVGELETEKGHCFIVADGLGGHGHGEVASAIALDSALSSFEQCEIADVLENSFIMAQNRILAEQQDNPVVSDMKTTMVDLIINVDGTARWGHIGDSRLYFFRNGKIKMRTLDHSVPQMLVSLGEITPDEIRGHEDRNRLLRVIGAEWESQAYEIGEEVSIKPKDAFLLCTDGFWELIDEEEMQRTWKAAQTVEEWMDMMIAEVLNNGANVSMDNNTAIAIWVNK